MGGGKSLPLIPNLSQEEVFLCIKSLLEPNSGPEVVDV